VWVYGVWAGDGAERREGRQRVVKEKTTREVEDEDKEEEDGVEGGRERLAVAVGRRTGERRGEAKDAK